MSAHGSNGHAGASSASSTTWAASIRKVLQERADRPYEPEHKAESEPVGAGNPKATADESAGMSDTPSREEIKAQIEASEARGETKIARLEGKMDVILAGIESTQREIATARTEQREDARNNRNVTIAATGLLLAVVAILAAFAPQMFDAGMSVDERAEAAYERVQEATAPEPQDEPAKQRR